MEGESSPAKETTAILVVPPTELEQPRTRTNSGKPSYSSMDNVNTNPPPVENIPKPASVVHKYRPSAVTSPFSPSPTDDDSGGGGGGSGGGGNVRSIMDYPVGGLPGDDKAEDEDPFDRRDYGDDQVSTENLLDMERSLVESATSNMQTLMHLIKGNLGTGILALPLAFKHAGLWTGLAGVLIIGAIALHCMHVLVTCGHILCHRTGKQTMDYADVAEYSLKTGPSRYRKFAGPVRGFVNVLLIFTQFGFCCVYVVFIAKSVRQDPKEELDGGASLMAYASNGAKSLSQVIHHYHQDDPDLIVYEILSAAVLIPYVFVRKLENLAPFSAFANILTLVGLIIIFQYIVQGLPDTSDLPSFSNVQDLPLFFGTAFFAFEGISLVLPLENAMKKPEDFGRWDGVLNLGMIIVIVLYASMGFYGYLKFGDEVDGSITLNLPADSWLYLSVKLMFAVTIFISYGIQLYVPIRILWPPLRKKFTNSFIHIYGEYIFRVFFVFLTFGFAAAIPHLDLLISLIGAFASSSLAIIIPVIIQIATLSEEEQKLPWWFWVKSVVIFFFGVLGCVTGTYSAMREIVLTF